ncbi:Lipid-A-disaccharide synthase [Brevundimonas diminuta]|uniref:Lipid-A-disaccharide synthase n=1 Tax=Brevundimonas diminuta TaxID=293 RepID=A0A2X1AZF4_BREDI|nr:Lipid-A-disaccharide synthase [Brevundimonas diminuta]
MSRPLKVMLVAAEASGDALGAGLARALKARLGKDVVFVGVGGPKMAAEGVASPFDIAELSILGWIEGLKAYGRVKKRVAETAALAAAEKPDAVVLIDSWGFTIRVAQAIRAASPKTPLIKYVGPQVWASRPGRAKTLAGRWIICWPSMRWMRRGSRRRVCRRRSWGLRRCTSTWRGLTAPAFARRGVLRRTRRCCWSCRAAAPVRSLA